MTISFRPHHFLCTLCFQGKGYSPDFIRNYKVIAKQLRQDDTVAITVTTEADSICTPCPRKRGLGCQTQTKIDNLDSAHAAVLGLVAGDSLTWGQAKQRIKERMTLADFHKTCESCSWKEYGVCETVLTEFLQ